ncbi:MAG: hypothetical protein ACM37W_19935 [Actinomycetota bacterium]
MSQSYGTSDGSHNHESAVHQLELFPQPKPSSHAKAPQLLMSAEALQEWKQRIFSYQQSAKQNSAPQQGTLFDLAPNPFDPDTVDPFSLRLQNLACLDLPDPGDELCLYFVIDNTLPLLLYVGETKRSPNQRWANHDCEMYISRYISLHRRYSLDVAVNIGFWFGAPASRKQRLQLESDLIYKWRSPFNKECWQWWGQPFGK